MAVVEEQDVRGMRWVRRRLLSPDLRLGEV